MLRILSWNSSTGFEKMEPHDFSTLDQTSPATIPNCAMLSGKRKRSFDVSMTAPTETQVVKELISDQLKCAPPPPNHLPTSQVLEGALPHATDEASDNASRVKIADCPEQLSQQKVKSKEDAQLATMRQTISSQLSLEILLKHKELRLIDQELAKCQIALEQLRRCTEIPFPAMQQPSEQVSVGKGPALRRPSERYPARSPAPWGVADGPYSRHYAKWLLPDPSFDGGEPELATPLSAGATPSHGRSTRGHYTDFAQMVGKVSRSQRALNQGLPPGYTEPKQKPTGPMILKRKSDGKMVKLVCPDCGRFDFGSAQGFINHCRIGHQRNYASHDAAAEGCGEPIELDENGLVKGTPQETISTPVIAVPTVPQAIPVLSSASHSTHPLVRSAHLISKEMVGQPLVEGGYVPKTERKVSVTSDCHSIQAQCSQTPNLSAFIQSQGIDLNLQDAVTDAKRRDDLLDEPEMDLDMEIDSPLPTPTGNSRHPHIAGKKQSGKSSLARDESRKPSFLHARGRESINSQFSSVARAGDEPNFTHFMPLLPSPTNESTQAPSLIDDDEEMDPQSPPSSDEHDEGDVHFHVRDDEHPEESNELRGSDMPPTTASCTQATDPSRTNMPSAQPFTRPLSSKSDRPINFIAERPNNDDQGDKKRRKIGS